MSDLRSIRYRAWDGKRMHHTVLPVLNDAFVDVGGIGINVIVSKLQKGELMQDTNFKDVNGNPIYEGDICRVTGGWSGNVTVVMPPLHAHHFYEEVNENMHGDYEVSATYEVIGNIYENPELIRDGR